MIVVEIPVAPYSPPPEIERWIASLQELRSHRDAEPHDVWLIDAYLRRARGWLADPSARDHDHAA